MGVNGTGQIYKGFTFDGIKSKDYGVYITGEGVYNAPVRDVEMITIPNRNGSFVLDHGRFENIEVTYPAGMFGATQTDFADGINALRNALASRKGYVRLEDEYNPNEYRMAVYKSGLEVSPVQYGQAGEFEIVFECKPQRFLKSGETAVSVANNGSINNPTLFESKPLLQVWGYGDIGIGSDTINIQNVLIGNVLLANSQTEAGGGSLTVYFPTESINTNDTVTVAESTVSTEILLNSEGYKYVSASGSPDTITTISQGGKSLQFTVKIPAVSFSYGSVSDQTFTWSWSVTSEYNGTQTTRTGTRSVGIIYNGGNYFKLFGLPGNLGVVLNASMEQHPTKTSGNVTAISTKSALGTPTYIDLDIGEAYKIVNSEYISVNNAVTMPAELPTLKPGATTVTYDNTITQFKIVPRWWKV